MKKIYRSNNLEETQKLAKEVADRINQEKGSQASVIALKGELGSGKTTFVQYLARALNIEDKVLSPTFVILKKFEVPSENFKTFYHIDCYRIEDPKEILKLGFEEIIKDPENIVVIEWADRIKSVLPEHYLSLDFQVEAEKKRRINVKMY